MLHHKTNVWYEVSNEPFEIHFDNWYYLNYYIEKGSRAICDIMNKDENEIKKYSCLAVYYHIKVEQLLISIKQINDRFYAKNEKREDLTFNRDSYNYSKSRFPTLTNSSFRNFIVHIFERNLQHIYDFKAVGGFNYFDSSTDVKLRNEYINGKFQNIALDLINNNIVIKEKKSNYNPQYLNIELLKNELDDLKKTNDMIGSYILPKFKKTK